MTRAGVQSGFVTRWHWGVAYGAILIAWTCLWLLAAAMQHVSPVFPGVDNLAGLLMASHGHHASYSIMLGMWMAMSVAMMLPGYIPVLRTYETLRGAGLAGRVGFVAITSGYLTVWGIYSVVMALVNLALEAGQVVWVTVLGNSWIAACLLLAGAGLYQLSPLKDQCLIRCRNPMTIFLARGLGRPRRDFETGVKFGLWCLGCCWLLMGIGLIAGLMSIAWMGLAMVVITLEKLPDIGRHVTRPLGAVLMAASIGTAMKTLS